MRWQPRGAIHFLDGDDVVASFCHVNARHEFLRVAIDHRKPCRLHLHHDAVAFEKHVVVVAQRKGELRRLAGFERRGMFVALVIASAPDFHSDGQFIAVERFRVLSRRRTGPRIPRVFLRFLRKNVDQFYDEVAVGSRRGSEQFRRKLAGDGEIVFEWRRLEAEDVRTVVYEALVGYFPRAPVTAGVSGRDGPLTLGNRIGWIGDVLREFGIVRARRVE